jgi:protein-tyrosine phosphatase
MKILMVCLGNICRSPLAEGILKSKLPKSFTVDSAGTIDYHQGNAPDFRSVEVAKNHQIDISKQKSRPITKADLENFDYIFCMDENNLQDVIAMTKTQEQKVKVSLILENRAAVPDPYYGNVNDFENVFQLLDKACDKIAEKLETSKKSTKTNRL